MTGDLKQNVSPQNFHNIPYADLNMVSKATFALSLGSRKPLRLPFLSQRSSIEFLPAQINPIDPPRIADVLERIGV